MGDSFGANLGWGLGIAAIILTGAIAYHGKDICDSYVERQRLITEKARYEYLSKCPTNAPVKDLTAKLDSGAQ